MKKSSYCFIVLVFLFALCFTLNPLARAEPIQFKAVCFLPKTHPLARQSVVWVNRVNEAFKDKIEVKYIGGPEITASKEQLPALKSGVFDINFNVTSYYAPYAPELNAFQLSKLMPWEERKPGGFYDYMAERHRKIGVLYLGRWLYGHFYVWTKKAVSKPDDLSGLKLRVGPMYIYFMKKLGVSTVSIKPTDVYTALERGTVDGDGRTPPNISLTILFMAWTVPYSSTWMPGTSFRKLTKTNLWNSLPHLKKIWSLRSKRPTQKSERR